MISWSRLAGALIAVTLAVSSGAFSPRADAAPTQRPIAVSLNDRMIDDFSHAPYVKNGTTFMPIRETSRLLQVSTTWIAEGKRIVLNSPDVRIELRLGSNKAVVNGRDYVMPTTPRNDNGVVFVPARFVAEALGARVDWMAKERRVHLTREPLYLHVQSGAKSYWVARQDGKLYASANDQPVKLLGDTAVHLNEDGQLTVDALSAHADIVTVHDNYGEPRIHNNIFRMVIANGKLSMMTEVNYSGLHPLRNIERTAEGHAVLMDGSVMLEVNARGEVAARHELQALTGYEDASFQVEYSDERYMAVRPYYTGWLTLVDKATGETVGLADALLDERMLEIYRSFDQFSPEFSSWDGLRVVGREGDELLLSHYWVLGGTESELSYPLAGQAEN